jgi:hypothetical protein
MTIFEKIKIDLPNFPDDIIMDWIEPYAQTIGWPPVHKRWLGILFGNDLEFWQSVIWEKEILDLAAIPMSPITNSALIGLSDAVKGVKNPYSEIENVVERHNNALKYFVIHGVFPKPICLLKENGSYSVVDGNHRITAFKSHYELMRAYGIAPAEKLKGLNETLSKRWGILKPADFAPKQEVWVATLNE